MGTDTLRDAEVLHILDLAARHFEGFRLSTGAVEIDLRRAQADTAPAPAFGAEQAVRATHVGTLRRGGEPAAGNRVAADHVLCHIDVLGTLHPVPAGADGMLVRFCCDDAAAVEFGQTLALIAPVVR